MSYWSKGDDDNNIPTMRNLFRLYLSDSKTKKGEDNIKLKRLLPIRKCIEKC
ncbi:MAG TPA: hypothetical protein VFY41_00435 [Nitrososphaeraceae archaeon]|nr:hypothetical protein [Nitrososphaeraceae archaeon]